MADETVAAIKRVTVSEYRIINLLAVGDIFGNVYGY
jgi:hypothetical protein